MAVTAAARTAAEAISIDVDDKTRVSALLDMPVEPRAVFVFAHGAGAGMTHAFMQRCAQGLADRGIATLRFNFPYVERGSKRPDTPALAHATVRAAVDAAARRLPGLAMFAGGKSFGGRMTSQAQAGSPLPGVNGLVFFGFPLHPAGAPAVERAEHLARAGGPLLFLQGTRDELADLSLLRPIVEQLGPRATLSIVDDADHSFHVRAKVAGRNDAEVLAALVDTAALWMLERCPR